MNRSSESHMSPGGSQAAQPPQINPTTPVLSSFTPTAQSPLMRSLLRFMHSPSAHATPTGVAPTKDQLVSTTPSSTPASPQLLSLPLLQRAHSNPIPILSTLPPASLAGDSRSQTPSQSSDMSDDGFRAPSTTSSISYSTSSSATASPAMPPRVMPLRRFSVSSGMPVEKAMEKRSSNSFLELLCKQDSFMNSD